jgi:hypothetical protein
MPLMLSQHTASEINVGRAMHCRSEQSTLFHVDTRTNWMLHVYRYVNKAVSKIWRFALVAVSKLACQLAD